MRFGNPDTPVEQAFTVEISSNSITLPSEKYYIQVQTGGGKRKVLKTNYSEGKFSAQSKFTGVFSLQVDSIPPIIKPSNFTIGQIIGSKQQLTWKVLEKETDLVDYDLYIDGEWQLLEYEYKGDYLIYKPRKNYSGTKELIITAKDSCGNSTRWTNMVTFH